MDTRHVGTDEKRRDRVFGQAEEDTFVRLDGFWSDEPDMFFDYLRGTGSVYTYGWWR
ncbi:MAG: hypothetical protein AB8B91_22500 [Rubripirellula sp.]